MKKTLAVVFAAVLAAAALSACGTKTANSGAAATTAAASTEAQSSAAESSEAASTAAAAESTAAAGEVKTIKVAASPSPHAKILEAAKEALKAKGYELEIVEFTDYVQPNLATESKDVDANYFQHVPYLDDFNKEKGTHLVSVGAIHYEPFGIYAGKAAKLDELADGAKIAVPNDTTNEARALQLLEANGILKLKEGAGLTATKMDIVENPKNVDIVELEAAQIPRSLQSVDFACMNGNYALEAGYKVADALAVEAADSEAAQTFANVIVVTEENKDAQWAKDLVEVLKSSEIQKFMEDTFEGSVIPAK